MTFDRRSVHYTHQFFVCPKCGHKDESTACRFCGISKIDHLFARAIKIVAVAFERTAPKCDLLELEYFAKQAS